MCLQFTRRHHLFLSLLFLLGISSLCSSARELDFRPTSSGFLTDVIHDGEQYVVANAGALLISKDGKDWEIAGRVEGPTPFGSRVEALASANGRYVAIASLDRFFTSADLSALSWEPSTSPVYNAFNKIAYGNGNFVAIGELEEDFIYSPDWTEDDGLQWTKITLANPGIWDDIVFAHGLFFIVGSENPISSPDGIKWSRRPIRLETGSTRCVTATETDFVVVGSRQVGFSPDAQTWTYKDPPPGGQWSHGAAGNETIVLLNKTDIATSTDNGDSWTTQAFIAEADEFAGIVYGPAGFVAITKRGGIYLSPDGTDWTEESRPRRGGFSPIIYDGTQFITLDLNGVHVSESGTKWDVIDIPEANSALSAIEFDNGTYVAVADNGFIASGSSLDSLTTRQNGLSETRLRAVAFGNGNWVAVGNDGACFSSDDSVTWSPAALPTDEDYLQVIFGAGKFIAFARKTNSYATSYTGETWTPFSTDLPGFVEGIIFTDGEFLAATGNGVYSSPDGESWTQEFSSNPTRLKKIVYDEETATYLAIGDEGEYFTTANPSGTWTEETIPFIGDVRGLAAGSSIFVLSGPGNAVYSSTSSRPIDLRIESLSPIRARLSWNSLPDDEEIWASKELDGDWKLIPNLPSTRVGDREQGDFRYDRRGPHRFFQIRKR